MPPSEASADALRGLLAACKADPDDDGLRLILADWLEERGDPRGTLVRLQVERSRLPEWDARQADLARREAALVRRHRAAWLGPLAARCAGETFRRGLVTAEVDGGAPIDGAGLAGSPEWEWVEGVVFDQPPSARAALESPLSAGAPRLEVGYPRDVPWEADWLDALSGLPRLTHLRLDHVRLNDGTAAELARSPHLGRLTSLEVIGGYPGNPGLVSLLSSPHLPRLRRLVIEFANITAAGLEPLAELDHPALTEFRLYGAELGEAGGRLLARSPLTSRLRSLALWVTRLGTQGFLSLFGSPQLAGLTHLDISSERMTVGGIKALGQSPHLTNLRSLELRECELRAPAARALAAAPLLARLERLNLYRNHLHDDGVAALVASPYLVNLRELNLGHNQMGDEGVAALARSPITGLGRLHLNFNGLGTKNARALAPWLARQQLTFLNLGDTYMGHEGLRVLADCPGLDRLIELDLSCADVGETEGARVLAAAPWLAGVVSLDLSSTYHGPEGLRALLDSGRLGILTRLSLRLCRLGDRGARLLADWPGLAGLGWLDLCSNQIGDEGAGALARSPHLSPALRLDVSSNALSDAAAAALRERLGPRLTVFRREEWEEEEDAPSP
jgi:uncharacterized protein (TIGR02996 family)